MKFKYEAVSERLMPNGFNVAFEGYINYQDEDGNSHRWGMVRNYGDGGSNVYYWAHPSYEASFLRKAEEVLVGQEFLEIEDEFVELLYQESVGIYA